MISTNISRIVAAALALAPVIHLAQAAEPAAHPAKTTAPGGSVVLEAGAGRVFRTGGTISSIFAADPKVVEVRPASHNAVFIFGVGPGRTTVAALDEAGNTLSQYDVTVLPSQFGAGQAAATAHQTMPGSNAHFTGAPDGMVVNGQMATPAAAEQAEQIAHNFIADKQTVENRTTIASSDQVTLRVRIAEISRTITRQLGINWTAFANLGRWGLVGALADGLTQGTNQPNVVGITSPGGSINTVLDLLAQDQLITMLAEPNLTARSGESASFLAGGEFPIPISGQNNQITLQFKQYGVSLAFVPTVMSDGRISLHVHPEVSALTNVGAVSIPIGSSLFGSSSLTIPALTVRRADTTVDLGSGQSFAIAGLLSANDSMNSRGLPYLGELPVIGALFKSDLFQRDKSELVIVVTPYIVHPVGSPDALHVPTDDFQAAGDASRLLLMRQRELGTGPGMFVSPSLAALGQGTHLSANDLPAGTGFILQ